MDKFYTGRLKDIFRPLHVRPYSFLIGYQGGNPSICSALNT